MSEQSLLPLSPAEKALVFAFREAVRESREATLNGETPGAAVTTQRVPQTSTRSELCRVSGRNGVCIKPRGHGQRHRYGNPPPVRASALIRPWEPIDTFRRMTTKQIQTLAVGNPCKVAGLGKKVNGQPSASDGWTIVSMERHKETGKVNVTVTNRKRGTTRIVESDRVLYKRPVKAAAL